MITQEFTWSNLSRLRRVRAQLGLTSSLGTYPQNPAEWKQFFQNLSKEIITGRFKFEPFKTHRRKAKDVLTNANLEQEFVLRKMSDNIRRAYGLKQTHRAAVIKQTVQALQENVPKFVLKIDIKSFFESVDRKKLLRRLQVDQLVSTRTILLLESFFLAIRDQCATGLPRGLAISTTLAEYYLREIESQIRKIAGVYYLARYVDDIMIFSYLPTSRILNQVVEIFKTNKLRVNKNKQEIIFVQCRCAETCQHAPAICLCAYRCKCKPINDDAHLKTIELLGYKFVFPDVNLSDGPNEVKLYISTKKITKIKTRIFLALREFMSTQDIDLLIDRVNFLTGNYNLDKSQPPYTLKGGIYFNYDLYLPFEDESISALNRLEHLDLFLSRSLLYAISKSPIDRAHRQSLLTKTFSNGHKLRRHHLFSGLRMRQIQVCWRHV
jgi:Reverse transcriptase (RNA-dependent DNA polymerase)